MKAMLAYLAFVLLFSLLTPVSTHAQAPDVTRFTMGAGFMVSQPKEEFRQNVGKGYGGSGNLIYSLDRMGWLSLAFDGSWLRYGHEKKRVPFSSTVGARVLVDVNTTNAIGGISIGPEFAVPYGPIRPYLNGAISELNFRTTSSLKASDNYQDIAQTTNSSDWTRSWVVGTGVRIPLPNEDSNFTVDVGIRYYRGGEASYLREGSIVDNPDGSITVTPLSSKTPYLVYAVGVRYRIPWRSTSSCARLLC